MAVNTQQIQELLGTGLSNEVVASAVGVDPSYISQLMSDPDFASVVIEKRSKQLTAQSARDLTIDGLEDRVLSKMAQVIDYVVKPEMLLAFFKTLNGAHRRGVPINHQLTNRTQVVALSLPTVVKREFKFNNKMEIIDVDDQTLVTMSSVSLLNKLKEERGGEDGMKYGNLAKQISTQELPVTNGSREDRKAILKDLTTPKTIENKELSNVSLSDL